MWNPIRRAAFKMLWPLIARTSKFSAVQTSWESLHLLALAGMNMGRGGDVEQSGEIDVIRGMLRDTRPHSVATVVDVGAHTGEYTLSVIREAKRVGKQVRIIAFEPDARCFEKLERNVGHLENVTLQNLAIGEKKETRPLFGDVRYPSLNSVYARSLKPRSIEMNSLGDVSVDTLDSSLPSFHLDRVDLLKLDIEGHEFHALRGAKSLIEAGVIARIQFEFGGTNVDSRVFLRDFFHYLSPRYDIHRILQHGTRRIESYREECEVFTPTNYLATVKNT